VVADRLSRKRILITTDILRAVVVLGFLLVRRPDQLWLLYVLTALQLSLSAFFQPARDAAIPTITTRDELLAANALAGASWSVMLALGAAVGGLVTARLGREAAFIIDAATASPAWMLRAVRIPGRAVRIPGRAPRSAREVSLGSLTGAGDVAEGVAYVRAHPVVAWLLMVKLGWGMGGGVLLLLVVFGERIYLPGGPAVVGALYAARGLGSAIGPFVARRVAGESPRAMRLTISIAFLCAALFYGAFSYSATLALGAVALVGAHMGGSVLWVFSTTLLQQAVPDRFRGRVFAAEWALITVSMSSSSYLTGVATSGLDPRMISRALAAAFTVPRSSGPPGSATSPVGWSGISMRAFVREEGDGAGITTRRHLVNARAATAPGGSDASRRGAHAVDRRVVGARSRGQSSESGAAPHVVESREVEGDHPREAEHPGDEPARQPAPDRPAAKTPTAITASATSHAAVEDVGREIAPGWRRRAIATILGDRSTPV
jgi:hypothetical protein